MRRPSWWIASLGGIGLAPAPGTVASAASLLPGVWLWRQGGLSLAIGCLLAISIGVWAVRGCGGEDDPGWVVIDELAGQWIALLALPRLDPVWLIAAFGLFRLFDILKPGPIGWLDRRRGASGVMGDDVLAGMAAALCLLILGRVLS